MSTVSHVAQASSAEKGVFDYALEAMLAAYHQNSLSVKSFVDDVNDRNNQIDLLRRHKQAFDLVKDSPSGQTNANRIIGTGSSSTAPSDRFIHLGREYYLDTGNQVKDKNGVVIPGATWADSSITGYTKVSGLTGMNDSNVAFISRDGSGHPVTAYAASNTSSAADLQFDTYGSYISDKISSYSSTNQLEIIKLQKSINDMNLLVTMMTNMLKSVSDTNTGVARNL